MGRFFFCSVYLINTHIWSCLYFSVYAESVRCLKNNIHCYNDGPVPRSVTEPPKLLLHMLQATEIMTSNMTCIDIDAVTDFNKYFEGCMGKIWSLSEVFGNLMSLL